MSFLTSRIVRVALPAAARTAATRPLSVSARKLALNEDTTNDPNRGSNIDKHKNDSLNKAKNGAGQWKDELASNSEQAIKADRNEADSSADDIKNLQKKGEELGKNKR